MRSYFRQMNFRLLPVILCVFGVLFVAPDAFSQTPSPAGKGKKWQQAGQKGKNARLANLSPDERKKLHAARQAALQDPAVKAAREKMEQAGREFRSAVDAAMIKTDPSIKSILDKVPPSPSPAER